MNFIQQMLKSRTLVLLFGFFVLFQGAKKGTAKKDAATMNTELTKTFKKDGKDVKIYEELAKIAKEGVKTDTSAQDTKIAALEAKIKKLEEGGGGAMKVGGVNAAKNFSDAKTNIPNLVFVWVGKYAINADNLKASSRSTVDGLCKIDNAPHLAQMLAKVKGGDKGDDKTTVKSEALLAIKDEGAKDLTADLVKDYKDFPAYGISSMATSSIGKDDAEKPEHYAKMKTELMKAINSGLVTNVAEEYKKLKDGKGDGKLATILAPANTFWTGTDKDGKVTTQVAEHLEKVDVQTSTVKIGSLLAAGEEGFFALKNEQKAKLHSVLCVTGLKFPKPKPAPKVEEPKKEEVKKDDKKDEKKTT